MTRSTYGGWRRLGLVLAVGVLWWPLAAVRAARISDVVVRCEAPDLDPESLRQLVVGSIRSLPGTEFDPRVLSDDVKRLYGLGPFLDVRTELNEQTDGSVLVVFLVKPRPTVKAIRFEGNRHFRDRRLGTFVQHGRDVPLDESQLAKDRAAILERYRNAGYHGTEVVTETVPVAGTAGVDVVFRIVETGRAKVQGVSFTGNTVFSSGALRRAVATRRPWWRYILRFGNYYDAQQVTLDKDLLRELYATKGYLDFAVEKVEEEHNRSRTWVTLVFHLNEGNAYTVSAVELEIEGDRYRPEDLRPLVNLRAGETYSSTTEQQDLDALRGAYEKLGHLDLRCYPVLKRDAATRNVAVAYRVREGLPSRIRDVFIVGNEITQDHVIRRELAIQPGDLGDAGKIRTSEKRLTQLNYFEKVEITPVATEREDLKDLRIQLEEKRTGVFSVGAGFSSDESILGFVEMAENNFDLSRLFGDWPPKGAGQRLRMRASVGTERLDFLVDFTEPWFLDRRLRLNVELFSSTRYFDEYAQRDTGLGVTLTRPLWTTWRETFGIRLDRVSLGDFDDPPLYADYDDPSIPYTWPNVPMAEDRTLIEEEGDYWANRAIFGLSRDTRDDFLFPRHGSTLGLNAELVTSLLGSYSNVLRLNLRATTYRPAFRQSVLRLRGEVSLAENISGDEVAIFDRYFAGGSTTLRGFDYREIGPVDRGENPLGGKSRFLGSVELAHPIGDFMFVHAFLDVGNVWPDAFDINPFEINASVGVGLQLKALPVRIEYGFPIVTDWDHLDGGGQIHFNIGYSF